MFLAGDVMPLTGDEQRFLLGKVRCNSCVLGAVIPSTVPNCPSCEIEELALELCVCCQPLCCCVVPGTKISLLFFSYFIFILRFSLCVT